MQTLLVVDDDPGVREVIRFALQKAGYGVRTASDGASALEAIARDCPALVVLDITMPELDGLEVCRRLRASPATQALPVLFLSSRDEEIDRILGLEMGGDDYLAKPFSPRELLARVKAILRRSAPAPVAAKRLQHGRLSLDVDNYQVAVDAQAIALTITEFGLLRTLMQRPGKWCSREHLMQQAYDTHRIVADRTIDSHVRRLRAKFADHGLDPIETLPSVGYRLGPCL